MPRGGSRAKALLVDWSLDDLVDIFKASSAWSMTLGRPLYDADWSTLGKHFPGRKTPLHAFISEIRRDGAQWLLDKWNDGERHLPKKELELIVSMQNSISIMAGGSGVSNSTSGSTTIGSVERSSALASGVLNTIENTEHESSDSDPAFEEPIPKRKRGKAATASSQSATRKSTRQKRQTGNKISKVDAKSEPAEDVPRLTETKIESETHAATRNTPEVMAGKLKLSKTAAETTELVTNATSLTDEVIEDREIEGLAGKNANDRPSTGEHLVEDVAEPEPDKVLQTNPPSQEPEDSSERMDIEERQTGQIEDVSESFENEQQMPKEPESVDEVPTTDELHTPAAEHNDGTDVKQKGKEAESEAKDEDKPDDPPERCPECIRRHTKTCDGARPRCNFCVKYPDRKCWEATYKPRRKRNVQDTVMDAQIAAPAAPTGKASPQVVIEATPQGPRKADPKFHVDESYPTPPTLRKRKPSPGPDEKGSSKRGRKTEKAAIDEALSKAHNDPASDVEMDDEAGNDGTLTAAEQAPAAPLSASALLLKHARARGTNSPMSDVHEQSSEPSPTLSNDTAQTPSTNPIVERLDDAAEKDSPSSVVFLEERQVHGTAQLDDDGIRQRELDDMINSVIMPGDSISQQDQEIHTVDDPTFVNVGTETLDRELERALAMEQDYIESDGNMPEEHNFSEGYVQVPNGEAVFAHQAEVIEISDSPGFQGFEQDRDGFKRMGYEGQISARERVQTPDTDVIIPQEPEMIHLAHSPDFNDLDEQLKSYNTTETWGTAPWDIEVMPDWQPVVPQKNVRKHPKRLFVDCNGSPHLIKTIPHGDDNDIETIHLANTAPTLQAFSDNFDGNDQLQQLLHTPDTNHATATAAGHPVPEYENMVNPTINAPLLESITDAPSWDNFNPFSDSPPKFGHMDDMPSPDTRLLMDLLAAESPPKQTHEALFEQGPIASSQTPGAFMTPEEQPSTAEAQFPAVEDTPQINIVPLTDLPDPFTDGPGITAISHGPTILPNPLTGSTILVPKSPKQVPVTQFVETTEQPPSHPHRQPSPPLIRPSVSAAPPPRFSAREQLRVLSQQRERDYMRQAAPKSLRQIRTERKRNGIPLEGMPKAPTYMMQEQREEWEMSQAAERRTMEWIREVGVEEGMDGVVRIVDRLAGRE